MVGSVPGGRSTNGICFGALGWLVDEGSLGGVELRGLAAALLVRYDDDEPGSPWTITLHVDERGTQEQQRALERILLGEEGGEHVLRLPWVRKPRELLEVHASPIRLEHGPDGYRLEVGDAVSLSATEPFATDEPVRCGIPGYDQPGLELVADSFVVDAEPFRWQLAGNCGYASHFDYRG
jgi:hypothetical protein